MWSPGRRSRKKRYAKLKDEMRRLSRFQQIQENLDRLKAATSEVEESDFESDFFGHEEEALTTGDHSSQRHIEVTGYDYRKLEVATTRF